MNTIFLSRFLNIALSSLLVAFLFLLSSCDMDHLWNKDRLFDYTPAQEGVLVHDCSSYTDWHFFSFAQGVVIGKSDAMDSLANEEWRKRTDWDLAFHRQDIKVNGGISGIGQGGILGYSQDIFDFDAVMEAPEEGYQTDQADLVVYDMSQMMMGHIGYAYTGVNPVTKDWAVLADMMSGLWVYVEKVFIVRTSDSKYAKIHLMNFKSDHGASDTVTMRYVYQPDGSLNLDISEEENPQWDEAEETDQ